MNKLMSWRSGSIALCIVLSGLLPLCCGCAVDEPSNPLYDAIEAEAMRNVSLPYTFKVTEIEVLDSTSFATEFDRRTNIFETRNVQNVKLYKMYMAQGRQKNASLKLDAVRHDRRILEGLDSIRRRMEACDSLNLICYYDYKVSADVKVDGNKVLFQNVYFAITPDNRVIVMTSDKKKLHRASGLVIPGYRELLDRCAEDD